MMFRANYGKRNCIICNKEYIAIVVNQLTCGGVYCKQERIKLRKMKNENLKANKKNKTEV